MILSEMTRKKKEEQDEEEERYKEGVKLLLEEVQKLNGKVNGNG